MFLALGISVAFWPGMFYSLGVMQFEPFVLATCVAFGQDQDQRLDPNAAIEVEDRAPARPTRRRRLNDDIQFVLQASWSCFACVFSLFLFSMWH